jgi:hypothetical protein
MTTAVEIDRERQVNNQSRCMTGLASEETLCEQRRFTALECNRYLAT